MRRLIWIVPIAWLLAPAPPLAAAERPNFLLILVDDLGRQDLSCEGSRFYESPNIDRIAARAMRFENGYAACQVCSPSRAAIQTGKYPPRVRITDYISPEGRNQPEQWGRNTILLPAPYEPQLALEEVTIAEALREGGYRTFFAGKWHLGGKGFSPLEQGYEVNRGGHEAGSPPGGYFCPYRNPALPDGPPGEVLPQRLARETVRFIEQHRDEPFFAMLSFYSVHAPIQCVESRWRKFRDKAESLGLAGPRRRFVIDRTLEVRQVQDHPVYAGMIEEMDDAVGQVLDCLERLDLTRRTVILFTSDNGGVSSGDGYSTSNLPLRGGKGRQWEGGVREPLYIVWPGVTRGTTTRTPAIGMDFYPTMLDIAGLPLRPQQHRDGVSLVPVLRGGSLPPRPLFWHYPHYGNQGGEPSAMIRDGDWKLIWYFEDGRAELYNLARDVGEQHDLAADEPQRAAAMLRRLKAWQRDVGARFPTPNPNYDPQAAAEAARRRREIGLPRREAQHAAFLRPDFVPPGGWWQDRKRAGR